MSRHREWRRAAALATTVALCLSASACSSHPGATATSTTGSGEPTSTTPPSTSSARSTTSTTTTTSTTATTTNPYANLKGWSEPQLLAQLVMVGGQFSDLGASAAAVRQGVGGLVLFGSPPAGSGPTITAGIAALQHEAAVRLLVSTDEEGGQVARLANVVGSMPSPREMANTMSPSAVQSLLTGQARSMTALGVNMDLAPVLDTASPSDTIDLENERSFSEDGATAASYGDAFINGLRDGGMIPTAKHFPGLGHANGDTDIGPATDPPLAELVNDDLVPFRAAIRDGVPVIMMSNVTEPTWGSTPASLNPAAYRYLRSLGYAGMVVTDSLDAGAISGAGYSGPSAVVKSIEAGADMAMITTPSQLGAALADLEQAVSSGALPMRQVKAAVEAVLHVKLG